MTRIGLKIYRQCFELETLPHADTLARLLEVIEVSEIQECMIELLKDLIRRKKFRNFLHNKTTSSQLMGPEILSALMG